MDRPEMKWNDLKIYKAQMAEALAILDEKIQCYTTSLNKKKQLQNVKEQLRHSVEAREENLKRIEAKSCPVKLQIQRLHEKVAQLNDEISEMIIESERLKFKKLNLDNEVDECRKELIKVNEIHLKAIGHYKKKLHVRLEMDENEQITFYFTDVKASVILTSAENGIWQLITMEPQLKCLNKLTEMLESTHDISGCLAHIRTLLQKKHKKHAKEAK